MKRHSEQPSGEAAATGAGLPAIDALAFARGLAVLRVFFGLILFSNGLSKLFSFTQVHVGIYNASLIDRPEARAILDMEVNERGGTGNHLPGLKTLVNDVILNHWASSRRQDRVDARGPHRATRRNARAVRKARQRCRRPLLRGGEPDRRRRRDARHTPRARAHRQRRRIAGHRPPSPLRRRPRARDRRLRRPSHPGARCAAHSAPRRAGGRRRLPAEHVWRLPSSAPAADETA